MKVTQKQNITLTSDLYLYKIFRSFMLKCFVKDFIVSPFILGFRFLCPLIGHQHKTTKGVYRAIKEPMKNIMQMIDPCSRFKVVKNSLRLVFCINLRIRSAEDLSWKYQLLPWIPLRWRKPLQQLILRLFMLASHSVCSLLKYFRCFIYILNESSLEYIPFRVV